MHRIGGFDVRGSSFRDKIRTYKEASKQGAVAAPCGHNVVLSQEYEIEQQDCLEIDCDNQFRVCGLVV